MQLHSLRLKNFRQYGDATLRFDRGLTGIVGTNGAGKSTILEAIAFALYGVGAARGSKDSIKSRRAAPRASVLVELECTVGTQRIRIERGLSQAAAFLGTLDTPVATSLGGVTEWVERTLGMTRSEFFTTYFTGQKELAVMGTLGPADRARFLSRVLGYDRLDAAQTLVREARRGLTAEVNALQATMPDPATLEQGVSDARDRLAAAQQALVSTEAAEDRTAEMEARLRPVWERAQTTWAAQQTLVTMHGTLTQRAEAVARDVLRLEQEQAAIAEAVAALPAIERDLATLPALREEGARLDREAAADTERQRLLGVRAHLEAQHADTKPADALLQEVASVEFRLSQAREVEAAQRAAHDALRQQFDVALEAWRTALAAARADLAQARESVRPLIARRDALVSRGPDAPCSTCGVALGERYETVLAGIVAEIEAATERGKELARAAASLEDESDASKEARAKSHAAALDVEAAVRHRTALESELRDAQILHAAATKRAAELALVDSQLAALPTTYDVARHEVVRADLARLAPLEARRAVLADKAAQAERVATALTQAQEQARTIASERATIEQQITEAGLTAEQYDAMRRDYTEAERAWRAAVDANRVARDSVGRAEDAVRQAEQRIADTQAARARLAILTRDVVLHEELDRTMGDLRAELNHALRPELADLASAFLETLTDGRYTQAEFGEDYQLTVLEDGLPKPVISGGEEDLCNLVLRLAISQMIAERSGTPFSLLILDEVFAALDEQRRTNVLTLLRRLSDRFAQVIVITHNDHVRDALDHVIRVTLDVAAGESRVSYGEGPALPQADAVAVVDLAVAA